jgi:hypothetical protein
VTYQPKHPSYYRLRATDCEHSAADAAATVAEQSILLRCAARWHGLADEHEPAGPIRSGGGS